MPKMIFVNLPVKDLDGHIWELIFMEPSALNQD